ncbi:amidase signature enzyme [Mytilinidion resinicola]|uniref:Amidase signature enzyme n=1 Tax=Mytilinidion resinicola TaxID=574789 RepID=A0A6A6XYD9_9PEZI|nr:amidase signature enzyme [Mytilinidion resinicola]KAF2801512.1 amidase signature enzyme [Mytilinidion resinicola]
MAPSDDASSPTIRRVDNSVFFELRNNRYVAWPTAEIPSGFSDADGSLVTVTSCSHSQTIDAAWLRKPISQWSEKDDVFTLDFLQNIVFVFKGAPLQDTAFDVTTLDAKELLKSWGNQRKYKLLNDGRHGWDCVSVAVPSRLCVHDPPRSPFEGARVALKDAFDVGGIWMSLCNKAYLELYPPAESTAPSLRNIIQGGASILGKSRLSSFLCREEPSESVDYQTAWNPRGDGYQGPGGSSSGSASAVGAYDWLDIGIGTDTNGSIRKPAQCSGCFGLRISQGAVSS